VAYTIRKQALKQFASAEGNLETANEHLLKVYNTYKDEHPDRAKAVACVITVIIQAQGLIDKVRALW